MENKWKIAKSKKIFLSNTCWNWNKTNYKINPTHMLITCERTLDECLHVRHKPMLFHFMVQSENLWQIWLFSLTVLAIARHFSFVFAMTIWKCTAIDIGNARAINKLIPGRLTVLLIIKPLSWEHVSVITDYQLFGITILASNVSFGANRWILTFY